MIAGGKIVGYDPMGEMIKSPFAFIINEDHLRNMLGLNPGYKNLINGRWTKLTLYRNKCRNWQVILQAFLESDTDIDIDIIDV